MAIVNGEPGFTRLTKLNVTDTLLEDGNPVILATVIPVDSSMVLFDGVTGGRLKSTAVIVDPLGNMTFTAINNNTNKTDAPELIQINSAADLTALAVNDVITVTSELVIEINTPVIQTEVRFVLDPVNFPSSRPRLEIRGASPLFVLEYIGVTGVTFVSGSLGDFVVNQTGLVDRTGGVKFIDVDNGLTRFDSSTIRRWDVLGDHRSGSFVTSFTRFADYEQGFVIDNFEQVLVVSPRTLFETDGAVLFTLKGALSDNRNAEITGVSGFMEATSNLCRVDPAFRESSRINISGCTLTAGGLLDTSGVDGSFTVVADASITTPVTINSITGSIGGLARFNFTPGPTLFNGQQVVSIGNSVVNYNRTIEITNVGSGFFESNSIFFSQAGTPGTFTSNSITLTDTATVLNELDTVFLNTTLSTDYDFGSTVYDQQTNTFRVNLGEGKTFTGTAVGAWSTRGLDQKNPKVLAVNNPNFADSRVLAFGELNNNSTATTILDGTYAAMNSTGLSENGITERFKLIDTVNNIFEITSNEPFVEVSTATIFATKTGSTDNYRFTLSVNGAVPVFATAPYAPMEVKTTKVQATLSMSLSLTIGDTFQIMVAGDGTTDSLTITDLFIT